MKKLFNILLTCLTAIFFGAVIVSAQEFNYTDLLNSKNEYYKYDTKEIIPLDVIGDYKSDDKITIKGDDLKYGINQAASNIGTLAKGSLGIVYDDLIESNVLSMHSESTDINKAAIMQYQTVPLASNPKNPDESKPIAISLSIRPKTNAGAQTFKIYIQAFGRDNQKVNNLGNILEYQWKSGDGGYLQSKDKKFDLDKFHSSKYTNLTIVLENQGDQTKDKITYFLDGVNLYEQEGLNNDFIQDINKIVFNIQGNKKDKNDLLIRELSSEYYNHFLGLEEGKKNTLIEGESLSLYDFVKFNAKDNNYLPTIARFSKVDINDSDKDILEYNETTKQFRIKKLDSDKDVLIKVKTGKEEKEFSLSLKKNKTTIKATGFNNNLLTTNQLVLVSGEKINLKNLVKVIPENATNKEFNIEPNSLNEPFKIDNGILTALSVNSITKGMVKLTLSDEPNNPKLFEVKVVPGVYKYLNEFEIGSVYKPEDDPLKNWKAFKYSRKEFGTIKILEDDIFLKAISIHTNGTSPNTGGGYLKQTISQDLSNEFKYGYSYKLKAFIKIKDLKAQSNSGKAVLKINSWDKDGNLIKELTNELSIPTSNLNNEYKLFSFDLYKGNNYIENEIKNFTLELGTYNTNDSFCVLFANPVLVREPLLLKDILIDESSLKIKTGETKPLNIKLIPNDIVLDPSNLNITIIEGDSIEIDKDKLQIKGLKDGLTKIKFEYKDPETGITKSLLKEFNCLNNLEKIIIKDEDRNLIFKDLTEEKIIKIETKPLNLEDDLNFDYDHDILDLTLDGNLLKIRVKRDCNTTIKITSKSNPKVTSEITILTKQIKVESVSLIDVKDDLITININEEKEIFIDYFPVTSTNKDFKLDGLNDEIALITKIDNETLKIKGVKIGEFKFKIVVGTLIKEVNLKVINKKQTNPTTNNSTNQVKNKDEVIKLIDEWLVKIEKIRELEGKDLTKELETIQFAKKEDIDKIKEKLHKTKKDLETEKDYDKYYNYIIKEVSEFLSLVKNGELKSYNDGRVKQLSPIAIAGFSLLAIVFIGSISFILFIQRKRRRI